MSHGNVVCSKCGATGYSKCPICRTVFADNQLLPMFEAIMQFKWEENCLTIRLPYAANDESERTDAHAVEVVEDFVHRINNGGKAYSEHSVYPTLAELVCRHHWQFAPGEHSTIGCGH